jgi:hypothetical protein
VVQSPGFSWTGPLAPAGSGGPSSGLPEGAEENGSRDRRKAAGLIAR